MPTEPIEPTSETRRSVGLVLSAGGGAARAYHAGTLAALEAATGWDPRRADLIVGTSAGSTAAAYLRAGLSAADDHARFTGGELSAEGKALIQRIRPEAAPQMARDVTDDVDRSWASNRPMRASLALRALTSRTSLVTGLAGLAPAGTWSNDDLGHRVRDISDRPWPIDPTWICATRVRDGRRVVFGRDDVTVPDIGTAAQASCAIPRVISPVRIGNEHYIDGATHSSTNADLVAALAFDLVVIVSSMTTGAHDARIRARRPLPWWYRRVLQREVDAIRSRGAVVLLIEPNAADAAARRGPGASQLTVARQAFRSAQDCLTLATNRDADELLRAVAAVPVTPR